MRLTKEQSRRRWKEIRELWWSWDPIGVSAIPDWSKDEYDNYLGPTLRLLEKGSSLQEITKYLEYVVGEYMGLGESGVNFSKPSLFASQLREWYEKGWRDSHV
jgi:hypothetical protein